jgi:hypothetical protein
LSGVHFWIATAATPLAALQHDSKQRKVVFALTIPEFLEYLIVDPTRFGESQKRASINGIR